MRAIALTGAFVSTAAAQSTITQNSSKSGSFHPSLSVTVSHSFDLFDSALGVLTGARLTVTGTTSTPAFAQSSTPASFIMTMSTFLDLSSSLGAVGSQFPGTQDIAVFAQYTGAIIPPPIFIRFDLQGTKSQSYDLSSNLSAFVGTGQFDVQCRMFDGPVIISNSFQVGGGLTGSTTAGCNLSLEYTYSSADASLPPVDPQGPSTTVPEPSTFALTFTAIGIVGVARRGRRRARAS